MFDNIVFFRLSVAQVLNSHIFLKNLIDQNLTPVICSITHDKNGQLLNTNADTVSSEIAISLSKYYTVNLIYCHEKNGVLSNQNDDNDGTSKITDDRSSPMHNNSFISSSFTA